MKAKPQWLDDQVWNEYVEACESAKDLFSPPFNRERQLGVYEKIIHSKDCMIVWRSIEKRKASYNEKISQKALEANELEPLLEESHIGNLLLMASMFALGPTKEERIPASVRVKKGEKIVQLVAELQKIIAEFELDRSDGPFICSNAIETEANSIFDEVTEGEAPLELEPKYWLFVGIESGLNPKHALAALERATIAWMATKPPVSHVNTPESTRLYFIREMTAYFERRYHSPLRAQVAALASAIYDCEIDSKTVAAIAPSKKTEK